MEKSTINASDNPTSSPTALWLLIAGTVVGILLAVTGILEPRVDAEHMPDGVIALVNDSPIYTDEYVSFLNLLEKERRNPLTDSDKEKLLRRMIEQKLMIQRGVALGLPESNPRVRSTMIDSLMQSITAETSTEKPSEKSLQTFYSENRNYFAQPPRIRLKRLLFSPRDHGESPNQRAWQAFRALERGDDWGKVEQRFADKDLLAPPDSLLPPHKLREYVGPVQLQMANEMSPVSFSEPLQDGTNMVILLLLEKKDIQYQDYQEVSQEVLREYQRRASEEALQSYLDELAKDANIVRRAGFLSMP